MHVFPSINYQSRGPSAFMIRFLSYRFSFNGQEMDCELKGNGNSYDFNFRIYDPLIGRFLSIDPLTRSYPDQSPYHFAGNTPIQAIDLEGLELFLVNGYDGPSSTTKDAAKSADLAKMIKYWTNNNPEFVKQATTYFKENDVRYLDGSQGGVSHGSVSERYNNGLKMGIELVSADKVDFNKQITIVGHSQGGAYGAGLATAFLNINPAAQINVLLLAPDGAEQFSVDSRTSSAQFTFGDDYVVTNNRASVKNVDVNLNPNNYEHSPFKSKSVNKGLKAHSAPIDDKGTLNMILNNAKGVFKTNEGKMENGKGK